MKVITASPLICCSSAVWAEFLAKNRLAGNKKKQKKKTKTAWLSDTAQFIPVSIYVCLNPLFLDRYEALEMNHDSTCLAQPSLLYFLRPPVNYVDMTESGLN